MSPMSMTVPKIRFGGVTDLIVDNGRNVTTTDDSSGVCSTLARRMWQFFSWTKKLHRKLAGSHKIALAYDKKTNSQMSG